MLFVIIQGCFVKIEESRGAAARGVTVKPTGCGFDPTRGDEIFTYIYILISSFWCGG